MFIDTKATHWRHIGTNEFQGAAWTRVLIELHSAW
jgi:hypothetical protein